MRCRRLLLNIECASRELYCSASRKLRPSRCSQARCRFNSSTRKPTLRSNNLSISDTTTGPNVLQVCSSYAAYPSRFPQVISCQWPHGICPPNTQARVRVLRLLAVFCKHPHFSPKTRRAACSRQPTCRDCRQAAQIQTAYRPRLLQSVTTILIFVHHTQATQ